MTLEYIIKQAFNFGYIFGSFDGEHDTDSYSKGEESTFGYFSAKLGIQDFENWDIFDWNKMSWEEEHPGE